MKYVILIILIVFTIFIFMKSETYSHFRVKSAVNSNDVNKVKEFLNNSYPKVRVKASAFLLNKASSEDERLEIINLTSSDSYLPIKLMAIRMLSEVGYSNAYKDIYLKLLKDVNEQVVFEVVRLLNEEFQRVDQSQIEENISAVAQEYIGLIGNKIT